MLRRSAATSVCRSMRRSLRDDRSPPLRGLVLVLAMATGWIASCDRTPRGPAIPVWRYQIVRTLPHRPDAFTQGLVIDEGFLYEGTGEYGRSSLCRLRLETSEVLKRCTLPEDLWGEGVTILGNRIYQLTWQNHVGFVYDKHTFDLIRKFTYATEGWGLTHDGRRLIMSDGTATLTILDPNSLAVQGTIHVRDDKGPVDNLNELEFANGRIYANIWQTERIAVIQPETGQVEAWLDLTGLWAQQPPDVDVLNGIAYDPGTGHFYVTGKLWPTLYEIKVSHR
jgi:glutamine cyclotransferase